MIIIIYEIKNQVVKRMFFKIENIFNIPCFNIKVAQKKSVIFLEQLSKSIVFDIRKKLILFVDNKVIFRYTLIYQISDIN
ncbi:hypothetical protein ES705_03402 [subsurface metagenome]